MILLYLFCVRSATLGAHVGGVLRALEDERAQRAVGAQHVRERLGAAHAQPVARQAQLEQRRA